MAKAISLFQPKTDSTKTEKQTVKKVKTVQPTTVESKPKRGRPPKQKTETVSTQKTKPIPNNEKLIRKTNTEKPKKVIKSNLLNNEQNSKKLQTEQSSKILSNTNWINTSKKLPEELRPIEFNTSYKKPVYGYRLKGYGYIVTNPYYINKFKKKYGYIEWRYIPYCTTLLRCFNEIPDCSNCKHSKVR